MPRTKKHPSVRARRNKAPTAATLTRVGDDQDSRAEEYAKLTVAQLKLEVDRRNGDGRAEQARLSKRGTKASLVMALVADDSPIPPMPPPPVRPLLAVPVWHPMTVAWWDDIWSSPMSKEWDESDIHNLYVLAALYDDIWQAGTATGRKEAATEYRLQRKDLGLTPYDRRRLEWTIETAKDAKDRGRSRRERASQPAPPSKRGPDPRAALHVVK